MRNSQFYQRLALALMLIVTSSFTFVTPLYAATGCKLVVGTRVMTVPDGTVDDETGQTCTNGVWGGAVPAATTLNNVPTGNSYARTVQAVGGWQRIREGKVANQYFPWNFFTQVACDRPLVAGEVSWDHPTLLGIVAKSADLTCQIKIKRDLASSANWQSIGAEMDPYDSALRGPNGQKQGEQLGWFLGSNGGLASINGSANFVLDISVCVTCTVPTDIAASGILTPTQWNAPASDTDYAHHDAAVVMPFGRNAAGEIVYVIQLKKAQQAVLWEGILVKEIAVP